MFNINIIIKKRLQQNNLNKLNPTSNSYANTRVYLAYDLRMELVYCHDKTCIPYILKKMAINTVSAKPNTPVIMGPRC